MTILMVVLMATLLMGIDNADADDDDVAKKQKRQCDCRIKSNWHFLGKSMGSHWERK